MTIFKKNKIQFVLEEEKSPLQKKGEHLLVVDDEINNLLTLERMLEDEYVVHTASSAKEAISILKGFSDPNTIKIILSNYLMPEMNGVDFLKEAALISPQSVRVILTGYANVNEIIEATAEGQIYKFMLKPVDKNDMLITIKNGLHYLKLTNKNIELIKELKKVNGGLKLSVQEATKKIQNLLRIVCHDISNPLTVASLSMRAILKKAPTDSVDIMKKRKKVITSLSTISEILEQVKNMQVLDSHKMDLKMTSVHFQEVKEHLQLVFDSKAQEKEIKLYFHKQDDDIAVLAESISLKNNVLSNLVSNAIKFSNKGDTIEIKWKKINDNQVIISVCDKGIGIPKDILEHLFDSDYKTSRLGTIGEKGTGFGMPIVKSYIEKYGGVIEVNSKTITDFPIDHGTEFKITLSIPKGENIS